MDSVFQVDWRSSVEEIPQSLWEACFLPPLEGRWWYQALHASGLEDQFQFWYGLIQCNGEPVGIAPTFKMDVPMQLVLPPALMPMARLLGRLKPSLLYQRTLFLGSPCADEGSLGLLPEVNRLQAMRAVHQALLLQARKLKAPMLVWKDFPASYGDEFSRLAKHEGLFPLRSYPGTMAVLPGVTKEEYFASLKASRRHILKKKIRRSAEKVGVKVDVIQYPDQAAMNEIFNLFWLTYEKATTKFERLNRAFFERIAQTPAAYFIILREQDSGSMIAFMLCFASEHHVINKFIGIDYARPKEWLLYFRLWDAALDWALSRGARSIQSGQTGYAPKIELGHRLVPLTNYCRHRNPLIHMIYGLVAKTVSWATLDEDLARFLKAHPEEEHR
ncbi:MAG: GNAT family N-acetyltransferase [Betaproteobacteria bacterium]|nr:GNAT family N-acetyltransferase [Betaproteobacteria bacterium]